MDTLKELFKQLQDKEAESKIIPENSDPRVRAGVEAMVRNAKESIGKIREQYKNAVMNHVVLIGATGPGAKEFAEIAAKEKCVGVNYTLIKDKIVANLKTRQTGADFNQHTYFAFLDELNKSKLEYQMLSLPAPTMNGYTDGIFGQTIEVAVSRLITKNYENSLYSAVSRREIGAAALANEFNAKSLPVVLYNYTGGVDTNFLSTPVTSVNVPENVTKKLVQQVFGEVRKLVTGKSVETTETTEEVTENE